MNLYVAEDMGKGGSYVAPNSHFISSISLFSGSLPWDKFEKFFKTKKLVNLSSNEQIILLRLIALQELLCLNDDSLLEWAKHQLYLFSFMQSDFQPRIPSKELLVEFRSKFNDIGLLKPFRKQCQRLISEHESRFPPIKNQESEGYTNNFGPSLKKHRLANDTKIDLPNIESGSGGSCSNCGSHNVIKLQASQEASSLPNISFSRCRFCGNTFRNNT